MQSCKACHHELNTATPGDYCICSSCGTASYITTSSAAEDNKAYFNSIYADDRLSIVERRRALFALYLKLDRAIHFRQTAGFDRFLQTISALIVGAGRSVEIGFGRGDEMVRHLRAGADLYGLELSEEAVGNFRRTYPEYGGRVACAAAYDLPADVIYSNALFEHLDDPDDFLENAVRMLKPGGRLVMRLPVLTGTVRTKDDTAFDINFWPPCHRALYTLQGLQILFERHGLQIMTHAALPYYGYRVMSRMLRLGYRDIAYTRCPYYHLEGLDSDRLFHTILLHSLFERIACSDFALIAGKG